MLTEQHLKVLEKAIELTNSLSFEELIEYQNNLNPRNSDYDNIFLCFLLVAIYKKEFEISPNLDDYEIDENEPFLDIYLDEFAHQYFDIWKPIKDHLFESAQLNKGEGKGGAWWWDETIKRNRNKSKDVSYNQILKEIFYELKVPTLKDAYLKLKQKLYDGK